MLGIKKIFNTFSKRNKIEEKIEINNKAKNRVIMLIIDTCNNKQKGHYSSRSFDMENFCAEISKIIMMRSGDFNVIKKVTNDVNDVFNFLLNCNADVFLDFLEDIFKTEEFHKIDIDTKIQLIEDINYIFTIENVEYEITEYKEYWISEKNWSRLESVTYPQIICKEDKFINSEIINPVMKVLMDDRFKNANNEFLEGLDHYKHKRYKESISSCCCALESVMKIICAINKWEYKEYAAGLLLIKTIIDKSQSPNWYEGVISPALTIRNKLGPHGKGTSEVKATKLQAQLEINLVASQIIFLVAQYSK